MIIPIPLEVFQLEKKDLKKSIKTVCHKVGIYLIFGVWQLNLTNMPSFQEELQIFSSN